MAAVPVEPTTPTHSAGNAGEASGASGSAGNGAVRGPSFKRFRRRGLVQRSGAPFRRLLVSY
jgi:hypothetical protein